MNQHSKSKNYTIPDRILNILEKTYNSYNGNKKIIGYGTLENILNSKQLSGHNIKKIIHLYKSNPDILVLFGNKYVKNWIINTFEEVDKKEADEIETKKEMNVRVRDQSVLPKIKTGLSESIIFIIKK